MVQKVSISSLQATVSFASPVNSSVNFEERLTDGRSETWQTDGFTKILIQANMKLTFKTIYTSSPVVIRLKTLHISDNSSLMLFVDDLQEINLAGQAENSSITYPNGGIFRLNACLQSIQDEFFISIEIGGMTEANSIVLCRFPSFLFISVLAMWAQA